MVSLDTIQTLIVTYLPTIIAICSMVLTFIKMVNEIKSNAEEIRKSNDFKEVNAKCTQVLQENYELKKEIKRLVNKVNRVVDNDKEE